MELKALSDYSGECVKRASHNSRLVSDPRPRLAVRACLEASLRSAPSRAAQSRSSMRACAAPSRRAPAASRPLAARQAKAPGVVSGVAVQATAAVDALQAERALCQSRSLACHPPVHWPPGAGVQSPMRRVCADCRFLN